MGGSGGGGYFRGDIDSTLKQVQEAKEKSKNEEYEARSNTYLSGLLSQFNDRDVDAINRHLDEIRKALEKDIDGTIDLRFGGSVAKHTYVDGLSDVDSLVMLDNCELAGSSPELAKDYLADRLIERFPQSEVSEGRLAVTVKFQDAEIQLLPAVSCRNEVKIPDASGMEWSQVDPRAFTRVLSDRNDQTGKKLVPVVKLAKALIANLPEQQQISGYHAESLAVDVFAGYKGPFTSKAMLQHFFVEGAKRVMSPILDQTGQSVHVDEYMGGQGSLERKIVSDAFNRAARKMERADSAGRVEDWQSIFGQ